MVGEPVPPSRQRLYVDRGGAELVGVEGTDGVIWLCCKSSAKRKRVKLDFHNPLATEERKEEMTRKKNSAKPSWKEVMTADADFMKALIQEVVQQVLEAEMEEVVGAEKGQRTSGRIGYRSG